MIGDAVGGGVEGWEDRFESSSREQPIEKKSSSTNPPSSRGGGGGRRRFIWHFEGYFWN